MHASSNLEIINDDMAGLGGLGPLLGNKEQVARGTAHAMPGHDYNVTQRVASAFRLCHTSENP